MQAHLLPSSKVLLAYSGGLDSSVLLHLLHQANQKQSFQLQVMHVHHGLSPNAEHWADFCREQCDAMQLPFSMVKLQLDKKSGLGIEATARAGRYKALFSAQADYVVLAHHQDDQAETILLQMLRGAGSKGLAAMAACDPKRQLLRPLLDVSRRDLEHYAAKHQIPWITDESNQDIAYDRNYLRHEVMPQIEKRFPAAKTTMARAAQLQAEASTLLDDLAELDAAKVMKGQQIDVTMLSAMTEPRAANLLRWWIARQKLPLPSAARLHEMLTQLLAARADASLKVAIDAPNHIWLRRYQGLAYIDREVSQEIQQIWQGEAEIALPDGSKLIFQTVIGSGLATKRLDINKLRISNRQGGERFKPDWNRPTRTLKHLMQEAEIAPWLRERMPLLYCEGELAVVPMVGIACHLQAAENEEGLQITWQQA